MVEAYNNPGPLSNFRTTIHGNHEVCDSNDRNVEYFVKCVKFDKFAYMMISGSKQSHWKVYPFYTGKLLLTLNGIGLKIVENRDNKLFATVIFFVSV